MFHSLERAARFTPNHINGETGPETFFEIEEPHEFVDDETLEMIKRYMSRRPPQGDVHP